MKTKLSWILGAIGALAMVPAVPGTHVDLAAQSQVAEGAVVYAQNCGRCHNARSPLERTDREWVTIVAHMRARGNLTKSQASQVLDFLQMANGTEAPAAPVAPTAPVRPGEPAAEHPSERRVGETPSDTDWTVWLGTRKPDGRLSPLAASLVLYRRALVALPEG